MNKVIPFRSSGKKASDDAVVDHGVLFDNFSYEIYKRGNIHIFDKNHRFKKDCTIFEQEIDKIDFDTMKDGDEHVIKGCGDSDILVFQCTSGVVQIILHKRGNAMITKLKSVLRKRSQKTD